MLLANRQPLRGQATIAAALGGADPRDDKPAACLRRSAAQVRLRMARLVAFLRGINVGGHRVKMDALRGHFVALKLRDVETFIASGNVIFATTAADLAALERKIERHLVAALGYEVPTMLRTMLELTAVGGHRPFSAVDMENEANSLNVLFLRDEPSAEVARAVAALNGAKDEFRLKGREIYWLCRGKISVDSLAAPLMGKAMKGCECTVRNLRTVRQLVELYARDR